MKGGMELQAKAFVTVAAMVCLLALHLGICTVSTAGEAKKVSGFEHPESVAYDPQEKVFYVSDFGAEFKPTLKDGKGRISKVSLTGEIIDKSFLPGPGDVLHKPKGIWVEGDRLWVTDIDSVWVFDLKSKKGRKIGLPGAKFANDPAVVDDNLFVSDTGAKTVYKVSPADFLNIKGDPTVTEFVSNMPCGPNGLCPAVGGALYLVGFNFEGPDVGVYKVDATGKTTEVSQPIGKLDGVAVLEGDTLLITDWKSKSLLKWHPKDGQKTLASGIEGPADFAVAPRDKDVLVVVPDLIKGDLYLIPVSKDK